MSRSVSNRELIVRASVLGFSLCLAAGLTGCGSAALIDPPKTAPGRTAVFEAARAVLSETYPMSSATERYGQLYATTGVQVEGATRTRREIAIAVRQHFTGAFEPQIAVTHYVETSHPPITNDPTSLRTSKNQVFTADRWRPIQRLPLEEQQLYEDIMKRVVQSI